MKSILTLSLIAVSITAMAQYHVQVRPLSYNCNIFQIAYTNDNWKTQRLIKEFSKDYTVSWYSMMFEDIDKAKGEAKKYPTWQLAEAHNRAEYKKSIKWLKENPAPKCCKTPLNIY